MGVNISEPHKQRLSEILAYSLATILVICGFALLTTGILEQLRDDYSPVTNFAKLPGVLAMILAVIVMIIAIVGFVSVIRNNVCGIKFFVVGAVVIVAAEFLIGILCFLYSERTAEYLEEQLNFGAVSYGMPGHERLTNSIDRMQAEFECCGYKDFRDWESHSTNFLCLNESHPAFIPPKSLTDDGRPAKSSVCSTPLSCCSGWNKNLNNTACAYWQITVDEVTNYTSTAASTSYRYEGYVYDMGCGQQFKSWIMDKLSLIGLTSLIMTIPQCVCLAGVVWLASYLGDQSVMYKSSYHFYYD